MEIHLSQIVSSSESYGKYFLSTFSVCKCRAHKTLKKQYLCLPRISNLVEEKQHEWDIGSAKSVEVEQSVGRMSNIREQRRAEYRVGIQYILFFALIHCIFSHALSMSAFLNLCLCMSWAFPVRTSLLILYRLLGHVSLLDQSSYLQLPKLYSTTCSVNTW